MFKTNTNNTLHPPIDTADPLPALVGARYNSHTGWLTLTGNAYPTREENLLLVHAQLYEVLLECHAAAPQLHKSPAELGMATPTDADVDALLRDLDAA